MAVTMTYFKVLPGKTHEYVDFVCDVREGRAAEHAASRQAAGIEVERAWLEPTASGDVLIMYFEGDDLTKSVRMLAESKSDYDVWYKERLADITGVDFNDPESFILGERVFESPRLNREGTNIPYATVLPVHPEQMEKWRAWLDELLVSRENEYRNYLERFDLSIEKIYLLHRPEGPMAILYAEGEDPAGAVATFARSHHPFDAWMREEMLYLNGIDFIRRQTAPPPDLMLDWKAETKRAAV